MLDSLLGDIIHTFKVRQMCMQRLWNILSFVNYSPNRAQMHNKYWNNGFKLNFVRCIECMHLLKSFSKNSPIYAFSHIKLLSPLIEILIVKFSCSDLKQIFCLVNDIIIERVLWYWRIKIQSNHHVTSVIMWNDVYMHHT